MLNGNTVQRMVGHTSLQMTDYYTRSGIETAMAALMPHVETINAAR